jgi:hypothetical protein
MDPIQPIERRSPWVSELVTAQTQDVSRKRRKTPRDADRKPGTRRDAPGQSSSDEQEPEHDGPGGRHIDVRA